MINYYLNASAKLFFLSKLIAIEDIFSVSLTKWIGTAGAK